MATHDEKWRKWIQEQGQQLFLALNALSACRIAEVGVANHLALQEASTRFDQVEIQRIAQISTMLGVAEHLKQLYAPIRTHFATTVEARHE